MVANIEDGWHSLFCNVSGALRLEGYYFRLSSDGQCNYMIHTKNGSQTRVVYTLFDDGQWVFYQAGTPLWFEDTAQYKKCLKKERLTKNMLLTYCLQLNLISDKRLMPNSTYSLHLEYKW
jgi:hypothetical protein